MERLLYPPTFEHPQDKQRMETPHDTYHPEDRAGVVLRPRVRLSGSWVRVCVRKSSYTGGGFTRFAQGGGMVRGCVSS
jgi:hypothetical protein